MTRFDLFPCLTLSVVALACSDGSSPTAPGEVSAPALSSAQGPAVSRAIVIRGPATYAAVLTDAASNLTLVAGVPFEQLIEVCEVGTGLFTFDPATFQLVRRPDGSLSVLGKGKDVNVVLFQGVFPGDFCTGYFSTPALAIGTVHALLHDNDSDVSGNRTNSYGEHFTGRGVYTESGQQVHISVNMQGLLAKDGSIRKLTTAIGLH